MVWVLFQLGYWILALGGGLACVLGAYWVKRLVYMSRGRLKLKEFGDRSWAVVTGGSDGIGKAFAEKLALEGFNLFLVARNEEKLNQVASELVGAYGVRVKTFVLDFSSFNISQYSALEGQLKALDVSFLVNNVGVNSPGFINKVSAGELNRILSVNIWPQLRLTHSLLPQMSSRSHLSAVISVSSITSLTPQPTAATYAATKAFNDSLSLGLSDSRVRFVSLQPGYVDTPHIGQVKHKFLSIPATTLVNRALRAVSQGVRQTSGYWTHELEAIVFRLLPEELMASIVKKFRIKNYNV